MDERLPFPNPTRMSDLFGESSQQCTWGVKETVEHLRRLCTKDRTISSLLLQHAIDKGQLLQSLKEQTNHGDWTEYLKELSIHDRQAQRLMSLPKWREKLIAENLKRTPQSLSVTQAFKLVSQWNQLSMGSDTVKVKGRQKSGYAFKFKNDTKSIVFTWIIQQNEREKLIRDLEADGHAFITQIMTALKNLQ